MLFPVWLCTLPSWQHYTSEGVSLRPFQGQVTSGVFYFSRDYRYIWRRQWHPTPVLLPGKSHGWRSLEGCSPWGRQESDTTEGLHFCFSLSCICFSLSWHPTPVFLPGESQGRGSLVGCCLWGRTELDTTEATQQQQQHRYIVISRFVFI